MVFFKIISENLILGYSDPFYAENFILLFAFTALIVAVLGASRYFTGLPLWLVIIMQYIIVISAVMLETKVSGFFHELSKSAYYDMFRSLTIPYAIFAVAYYIKCFHDVHKANQNLEQIHKMTDAGIHPHNKTL